MAENRHTKEELMQWQALPLSVKIRMSQQRIRDWIRYFGEGGVYVSFSGGKDSTVLVDLIDKTFPENKIPLVFVDTGLEYPEIREFVREYGDRVIWLKPEMTFKEVINKHGYPFISKEVSSSVQNARKYIEALKTATGDDEYIPQAWAIADFLGIERREKGKNNEEYELLKRGKLDINKITPNNEYSKMYDKSRYKYLLDAPFEISDRCCFVMKKNPAHKYEKDTDRKPITGQMASESRLRATQWIKNGCNSFECGKQISNPLSFWTEQDVLLYIKKNNIKICSVYGEVVEERMDNDSVEGQITIADIYGYENMELFDIERPLLKTTGCKRTGCMFCGYGCTQEKQGEGRFEKMKITHPIQYDYIMRPKENGGLGYKEVIDWINDNGNGHIYY